MLWKPKSKSSHNLFRESQNPKARWIFTELLGFTLLDEGCRTLKKKNKMKWKKGEI